MRTLLVGVDVGTGSARAGVFDPSGVMLGRAEHPISMRRIGADGAEHDSTEIWASVCTAVREALRRAAARPEEVAGLAFDATCSLVVRDGAGEPLPISDDSQPRWDTIVWLDHRAKAEAEECTATGHRVLSHLGGVMSPEMEIPKLMWLKRHRPEIWDRTGLVFDLVDYLGWRASGSLERSGSSLTCKWTYLAHEAAWPHDFFDQVGLPDLIAHAGLPQQATAPGAPLGPLTDQAAEELGLTTRCIVGVGLIDAHAGALGVLGGAHAEGRLALIAGTSNSIIALSPEPRPQHGIWGPYFGAIVPDRWLSEGGISAAGALLDHLIRVHRAGGEPTAERHAAIIARIAELRAETPDLAPRLHILPDFHGNRSPAGDPSALGVISGLNLDEDFDSLCKLYWRASAAIALNLRAILEVLGNVGFPIDTLHVTGGHTRNPALMRLYADATGATLMELESGDAVLLGTAMLAAAASGVAPSLAAATSSMAGKLVSRPPDPAMAASLDRDYRVQRMMRAQREALDLVW